MSFSRMTVCCVVSLIAVACVSEACSQTPAEKLGEDVWVSKLADGVWLHTTYHNLPGYGRVPANGLVVVDGGEAALVDLPWTDGQTSTLLNWMRASQHAKVRYAIPTHFHQDCVGGLAEAHRWGASSFALSATVSILRKTGNAVPQHSFDRLTTLTCGATKIVLVYPGPAHTSDNIVAWIPDKKILFGGCIVKEMRAMNLGNTSDGDVLQYPKTLGQVKRMFADAKIVVPGHGAPGGLELVDHTIALCRTQKLPAKSESTPRSK